MSPHLDLLFPAREAMVKLTMELMRGGAANKKQTSSMAWITNIRAGFEASVLSLPANMRVSSLVADVRKSIDQLQRRSMELATRIKDPHSVKRHYASKKALERAFELARLVSSTPLRR